MKRARGTRITLFLAVASFCIVGVGFFYVKSFFTRVNEYSYTIDARFSEPMRMALGHFLQHDDELKDLAPSQLYDFLQKNFSCIQTCQVQHVCVGSAHIALQAADPLYVINDTQIVTSAATIVALSCYAPHVCALLPRIACVHTFTERDAAFMVKMPTFLARAYTVTWRNEHEICLRNAAYDYFSMVCSIDALPAVATLQACEKIREQVEERAHGGKGAMSARGGVKKHWVADIRFDKQIVLFPVQEGIRHG